jgi:hypothetical protein
MNHFIRHNRQRSQPVGGETRRRALSQKPDSRQLKQNELIRETQVLPCDPFAAQKSQTAELAWKL